MLPSNWLKEIKKSSAVGDQQAVANLLDGVRKHIDQIVMLDGQWQQIRENAAACGLPVEITKGQVFQLYCLQGGCCALTGLPIRFHRRWRGTAWKASDDAFLDRVDGGRGYVPGNVWWLHRDVGRMKLDLPLPRFMELCRLIAGREAAGVIALPQDLLRLMPPPDEASTSDQTVDRYLRERVEPDPLHRETAAALWQSYLDWCQVLGAEPSSQTALGRALRSLGYEHKRGHIVTWSGLRLISREGARVSKTRARVDHANIS